MLIGQAPFKSNNDDILFQKIVNGSFDFPSKFFDDDAKELIRSLLNTNPSERLGCSNKGVREIKESKWFAEFDFKKLINLELEVPWIPIIKSKKDSSNFFCDDPEERPLPYKNDGTGWEDEF